MQHFSPLQALFSFEREKNQRVNLDANVRKFNLPLNLKFIDKTAQNSWFAASSNLMRFSAFLFTQQKKTKKNSNNNRWRNSICSNNNTKKYMCKYTQAVFMNEYVLTWMALQYTLKSVPQTKKENK